MVDLRLDLAGIELKNPIVVASSDVGCRLDQIEEAEHYGAGAFITKGCIPRKNWLSPVGAQPSTWTIFFCQPSPTTLQSASITAVEMPIDLTSPVAFLVNNLCSSAILLLPREWSAPSALNKDRAFH